MTRKNLKFFVAVLFCAAAVRAWAQGQDAEGCKDHPLVSRYPASVIKECRTTEFDELTLPLGKTNRDGVPAKSQHLEGKIRRISYEAPAHRSILEIYRNYEAACPPAC